MIFEFKNIGTIELASIELNGLTVLTGANDTGKSFLGKSIFGITKTVSEAEQYLLATKYDALSQIVNNIFSSFRQFVPLTQERTQKFNPRTINQPLIRALSFNSVGQIDSVKANFLKYTGDIIDELEDAKGIANYPESYKTQLQNAINIINGTFKPNFIQSLEEFLTFNDSCRKYFDKRIVQGIFQLQLNNIQNDSSAEIKIKEGNSEIINIIINNNVTEKFEVTSPFFLKDATIIETPTIIQLDTFIANTFAFPTPFQERSDIPFHYYDLVKKIKVPKTNIGSFEDVKKKISDIIIGEFRVDENSQINYYKASKEGSSAIKSSNIASGIKSFGLLQLLLNTDYLSESSLLIIDEPEVHLHPIWEVKYADIIVALCKAGVNVVISTHSPYILREIRKLTLEDNIVSEKTKFYFGEKNYNGKTIFRDVTDGLEPVYKTLAEAMASTA